MQGPQAPGGYGPDGGAAGQYPPQQPQQYPAAPPQQHYAGAAQTYAGGPPQDHASAYPPAGAGQGGGPGAAYAVRDFAWKAPDRCRWICRIAKDTHPLLRRTHFVAIADRWHLQANGH